MAADEVLLLNLFDSHWFGSQTYIITPKTSPISQDDQETTTKLESSCSSQPPSLNIRSLSDHHLMVDSKYSSISSFSSSSDDSLSPSSVLAAPKLQTIFSGKEVKDFNGHDNNNSEEEQEETRVKKEEAVISKVEEVLQMKNKKKVNEKSRRRNKGKSSKSLSELEFEELKGFMDLGFVFTEEGCKDSKLVSMIPGLQRFCEKCSDRSDQEDHHKDQDHVGDDHDDQEEEVVSRPYLSEAWDVLDLEYQRKKKEANPVNMNWKIPTLVNDIDMKDQLRFWAHTVASTVR